MALPKFTLKKNKSSGEWELVNDQTSKAISVFKTKQEATSGSGLERALGSQGGSVKITLENGTYEEERTYPRRADPRSSPG